MNYINTLFKAHSKVGTGVIMMALDLLAQFMGFDPEPGSTTELAHAIWEALYLLLIFIGQVDRKDLVVGIVRKEPVDNF